MNEKERFLLVLEPDFHDDIHLAASRAAAAECLLVKKLDVIRIDLASQVIFVF
jgi:hypothetical protein